MTEDEMAGWHHQLNGHGFDQTPGDSEEKGVAPLSSNLAWEITLPYYLGSHPSSQGCGFSSGHVWM